MRSGVGMDRPACTGIPGGDAACLALPAHGGCTLCNRRPRPVVGGWAAGPALAALALSTAIPGGDTVGLARMAALDDGAAFLARMAAPAMVVYLLRMSWHRGHGRTVSVSTPWASAGLQPTRRTTSLTKIIPALVLSMQAIRILALRLLGHHAVANGQTMPRCKAACVCPAHYGGRPSSMSPTASPPYFASGKVAPSSPRLAANGNSSD